ncbi:MULTISPECIES: ABC transporter permease [Paracoccaceae]|uniref:ABC transporter permease n=1 Tax=Paracoccaceae TaxID=31989 RepID=UPI0030493607
MGSYSAVFDFLGLRAWCDESANGTVSMNDLLEKMGGGQDGSSLLSLPFPSLDVLNQSCSHMPRTRDLTVGIENLFLWARGGLKSVLDPATQPLSWLLDGAIHIATTIPWWIMLPAIVALSWQVTRSLKIAALVLCSLLILGFVDHLDAAMQTLAIIFVCTGTSVLIGVPIGIAMAKSDRLQRLITPLLDLLQTLPTFVYLIPLIFLFSVTESKLYGIAIISYAIVPVIRLTDLGIRLVDTEVIEAADAFGMTSRQRLLRVELPLAIPNIMAGINQTIMMSLAMVVIASLVSAPGLGILVLRGINNLDLGVGVVAGLGIVLLAIMLDRTSKAALLRTGGHAATSRGGRQ